MCMSSLTVVLMYSVLTVEVHACLELAHRLHTAHVLVLSDEHWLVLFAQSLNFIKENGTVRTGFQVL